jgi:hypothetical protein
MKRTGEGNSQYHLLSSSYQIAVSSPYSPSPSVLLSRLIFQRTIGSPFNKANVISIASTLDSRTGSWRSFVPQKHLKKVDIFSPPFAFPFEDRTSECLLVSWELILFRFSAPYAGTLLTPNVSTGDSFDANMATYFTVNTEINISPTFQKQSLSKTTWCFKRVYTLRKISYKNYALNFLLNNKNPRLSITVVDYKILCVKTLCIYEYDWRVCWQYVKVLELVSKSALTFGALLTISPRLTWTLIRHVR